MTVPLRPELLARYGDRQIPRYTSYPTAPHFRPAEGAGQYREWLGQVPADEPVSLYLHVPFCRAMCWYCGCHTSVTRREEPVARYLETLEQEIALVADALPARVPASHIHFGGGTPTIMTPGQFERLAAVLHKRFAVTAGAEIAIEIDPRTLAPAMVEALARGGVNRASLGVQSFDPAVQQAINRVQPLAMTERSVKWLRAAGIRQVNFDLIYGLPRQTLESCLDTVRRAVSLAPDRLAVFGYAHVPGFKRHQRKIDEAALPDGAERLAQSEAIGAALVEAGYVQIGLDHFALRGDPLTLAAARHRLHRNFQGYTTDGCATLLGFGASAIGQLPGGFVQNAVLTGDYQRRIASGELALARQCPVDTDDRLRGRIIERIMCDYRVDLARHCAEFDADPAPLAASPRLKQLVADGMVRQVGTLLEVVPEARPYVRAVAAAFDRYLDEGAGRHSRAV
jgi:oxygen-independent coproporphyrinogen-3 oxidase